VISTHKKSLPLTKVNSLLFLDAVYFRGEFITGSAYETRDAISTEYVIKKKKEKDHKLEKVIKNII